MKLIAIALLVIRTAVRSRLLICLVGLLLLAVVGLPATIKGDGTLIGQLRVLLEYTLGISTIILGIATLWSACAGVSRNIEGKQIRLVAVKPVRKSEIWLGNWLGLLILNGCLVCFVGATIYGSVLYRLNHTATPAVERQIATEEFLVGQQQLLPRPEDMREETQRRLKSFMQQRGLPDETPREELETLLGQQLQAEQATVAPSESKQWVFEPETVSGEGGVCALQFRLASAVTGSDAAAGMWTIGTTTNPQIAHTSMASALKNRNRIALPASLPAAGERVTVTYRNGKTGTVIFSQDEAVVLLVRRSGFAVNFLRSLLVLFCHLALLSALGLTAGCLFSLPVATFVSTSVVFVALVGHYITLESSPGMQADRQQPGMERSRAAAALRGAGEAFVKQAETVVAPSLAFNPIGLISEGQLVSWRFTGRSVLMLGLIYPLVFCLLGTAALRRRELAL